MEVICSIIMAITQFKRDLSSLFVPYFHHFIVVIQQLNRCISLWVLFLTCVPCTWMGMWKQHLGSITMSSKEFQFNYLLFCYPHLPWFLAWRGWWFFVLQTTNLGHVATLFLGYSLASQGGMCIQNLGSTTMSQKGFQFNYSSFGCLCPTWFLKNGWHFLSSKKPTQINTFISWSTTNLKLLVWKGCTHVHTHDFLNTNMDRNNIRFEN